jgi:hypothetical protein
MSLLNPCHLAAAPSWVIALLDVARLPRWVLIALAVAITLRLLRPVVRYAVVALLALTAALASDKTRRADAKSVLRVVLEKWLR